MCFIFFYILTYGIASYEKRLRDANIIKDIKENLYKMINTTKARLFWGVYENIFVFLDVLLKNGFNASF